jgi:hypothetical protein
VKLRWWLINVHSFLAISTVPSSSLTIQKNRAAQRDFVSIQIDVEFEVDSVGGLIVNFHRGGPIWALAAAANRTGQSAFSWAIGRRLLANFQK